MSRAVPGFSETQLADPSWLVQAQPQKSRRSAVELLAGSTEHTAATEVRLLRLVGQADVVLEDFASAAANLERARARADAEGLDRLANECCVPLASALFTLGESDRAELLIGDALARLRGAWRARARSVLVLARLNQGRTPEALREARLGLAVAERCHDLQSLCAIYNNRGVVYLDLGHLGRAERDFARLDELLRSNGHVERAAYATQNLAVVAARLGELPRAFTLFEQARREQDEFGVTDASLFVDYCEALFLGGLADDAAEIGSEAVRRLELAGNKAERAPVHLLLARVAVERGQLEDVVDHAERAADAYVAVKNERGAARARLLLLLAGRRTLRVEHIPVVDDTGPLATPEHLGSVVPIADRLIVDGDRDIALAMLETVGAVRRTGPMSFRLDAWTAEARRRHLVGNSKGARRAVSTAFDLARRNGTVMAAGELQSAVARRLRYLGELGAEIERADGRPANGMLAVLQSRALAVSLVSNRPTDQRSQELLARRRSLMTALDEATNAIAQSTITRQVGAVERAIRRHGWTLAGRSEPVQAAMGLDDVRSVLSERRLVVYVELQGNLVAYTTDGDQVDLHDLGRVEPVEDRVNSMTIALELLATEPIQSKVATDLRRTLGDVAADLNRRIVEPIRHRLGSERLVISPSHGVEGVRWALLPTLRGIPVEIAVPVAGAVGARRCEGGSVVVVAGPGLAAAEEEANRIGRVRHEAMTLTGRKATIEAVLAAIEGAETAHLCGHGELRSDNPLLSSIRLHDGALSLSDLEPLDALPTHITLSACDLGQRPRRKSSSLGAASFFLSRGSESVVASSNRVGDSASRDVMIRMHELLAAGNDTAAALAKAQVEAIDEGMDWSVAGFTTFVGLSVSSPC